MSGARDQAREQLGEWQAVQPGNFFSENRQLRRVLTRHWGHERFESHAKLLRHFGRVTATELDQAAEVNNRVGNLPRLERWSNIGERIEGVEHHPSYDQCGKAIYEDGRVIAVYAEPGNNLLAQALFYVSSHAGEAGHNCPVACTAGVVKALSQVGSDELRERWLPGLLTERYEERLDGAQFLTEVQGGSDVGANCVRAESDGEGFGTTRWRINGEKWFCSNVHADLILMTARVGESNDGTRGLGLFLVPRLLEDGRINGIHIRRLKDKLGTRSMASAEVDFVDAVGYAVGPVEQGFMSVISHVINTSRLYNTVGCTGMARRAVEVASAYAETRHAFGQAVMRYPLMQEMIASIRATEAVMLSGALGLAALADRQELGELDEAGVGYLRVATNLSKMRSCQHSHRIILTGIETLGGNGAIESFSILPRLLRDNVVYENWEGTHNTLIAQTVRDFSKHGMHAAFFDNLSGSLAEVSVEGRLAELRTELIEAISATRTAIDGHLSHDDAGVASLLLRPHLEVSADLYFATSYFLDLVGTGAEPAEDADIAALSWFLRAYGKAARSHPEGYVEEVALLSGASTV